MNAPRKIGAGAANDPAKVAAFAALFDRHPSSALIANLDTRVETVEVGGQVFPLTLNDRDQRGNCYICRPSAAYIDYGLEETRHFVSHAVLRAATRALIRSATPVLRLSGLDHQVQVNNWLLSTNPVPSLDRANVAHLRDTLLNAHPDRAIVLRSLNALADAATMAALRAEGFTLLPARQVYFFADRSDRPRLSRDMTRDRKLLDDTSHEMVGNGDFLAEDYARAADLYAMLYLDKYTPLNPRYTALCVAEWHRAGIIEMLGLRERESGALVAVTGMFLSGTTLTQPIVGYDTTRPQSEGLYRMMMAASQRRASEEGLFFNMSAGAAGFKRSRGAVPVVEYTAVHVRHLPPSARGSVAVMEALLRRVGVPLLERFGL
ncbi:GNAT family N-acetyltransferase [Maritimibacter sp. UBA3975]|uniref:GNAT family N-acetyltransferase n=1 Tax=Maritimibacter sp. UBA3975 TaxID=1946833 RepID=UPI000C09DE95|nr:GNAT family N-acetyltransferase [Maritimibacter sp. UBA3975]MAM62002.1 GNAT family N-acetyltransferase [Maritimibacter sp.]|tara:strand:- start:4126 stop:5256 length:1131 start_codon:yes stop_codon:yes gene_type:complete